MNLLPRLENLPPIANQVLNQFNYFTTLDYFDLRVIFGFFDLRTAEFAALRLTCKSFNDFLAPSRAPYILARHVTSGEQIEAERLLKKHPELLLSKSNFKDPAGRIFSQVTSFEYAVWATDTRHMCNMMIDCIPRNAEGERIREGLQKQLCNIEQQGLKYFFSGFSFQQKHYPYSSLIEAICDYVIDVQTAMRPSNKLRMEAWAEKVGRQQLNTVAHVAQHLREPFFFNPFKTIIAKTLDRQLTVHHHKTHQDIKWWDEKDPGSKIAKDVAVCRGLRGVGFFGKPTAFGRTPPGAWAAVDPHSAASDAFFLERLFKQRTGEDWDLLKTRLAKSP